MEVMRQGEILQAKLGEMFKSGSPRGAQTSAPLQRDEVAGELGSRDGHLPLNKSPCLVFAEAVLPVIGDVEGEDGLIESTKLHPLRRDGRILLDRETGQDPEGVNVGIAGQWLHSPAFTTAGWA